MTRTKNKLAGKVYLIGAGPGAPGLLTLRGAALLRNADAVVYDGLVSPELLRLAADAEKFYAGKYRIPGKGHCVNQNQINSLLGKLGKQGKKVARLKGGDPFVFGRGGEEASYLKKAGIPFEVVPGVSAGFSVPAYAGIPVTDRRFASSAAFVTAHENPEKKENRADWDSLAKFSGTLVIFMGIKNMARITKKLVAKGKSPKLPASVIEWGTLPGQRVVTGTLANIARKAVEAGLHSPALTVIGEVNQLRCELNWFDERPLSGKTVLITRASHQAGSLQEQLEEKGAQVLAFPVIEILPPADWEETDAAVGEFENFDWIVFTSANGVEFLFRRIEALGKDSRIFAGKKIAVIGEATADALAKHGLRADLIPETYTAEGLAEAFRHLRVGCRSFLLARTDIAPPYLREELSRMGARVKDLTVYRTVRTEDKEKSRKKQLEKWLGERKIDFITFTSSSTVKHFFEALTPAQKKKLKSKFISIGPVTSGTLKEYGMKPYREAKTHTISGMVEAMTS